MSTVSALVCYNHPGQLWSNQVFLIKTVPLLENMSEQELATEGRTKLFRVSGLAETFTLKAQDQDILF